MSTVEKPVKKKSTKGKAKAKSKNVKAKEPLVPPPVVTSGGDVGSQSSVISVREAIEGDKQDNSDKKPDVKVDKPVSSPVGSTVDIHDTQSRIDNSPTPASPTKTATEVPISAEKSESPTRPVSAKSSDPAAGPSKRPLSAAQRSAKVEPSGREIGSTVSIKSQIVSETAERAITPVNKDVRPNSSVSKQSQDKSVVFAPAEMNQSHAYVPYLYARDTIGKIANDMKRMKENHLNIIGQIEINYKNIEDESQGEFNMFVMSLQQRYGEKVKTFRQVIDVHRLELQHKQEYWDEALQSLSHRNKQLLNEKRKLLMLNKRDHDNLEQEKIKTVDSLTHTLDNREKEISELKEQLRRKEREYEEDKERELQEMEKVLKEEWKTERKELEDTIEELKNQPISADRVTETESVQRSTGATTADLTLVTELERKLQERETTLLLCRNTLSEKESDHEKEKVVLQQDVKKLERELSKLKRKINGDLELDSDLEKLVEQLEEKVMQLELQLSDTAADRMHFINISEDQKSRIADLDECVKVSDTRVSHLLASVADGERAQAELSALHKHHEHLREKNKTLEQNLLKRSEEIDDHDKKADKLRGNMEKDMKKMLKEIAKLRKQLEESPDTPSKLVKEEEKMDKMEGHVIDLEHKMAMLTADKEYYSKQNKLHKQRCNELRKELYTADTQLAALTATASTRDVFRTQLIQTQINSDEYKQKIQDLEQQIVDQRRETRDLDRQHKHALWEQEKKQAEMNNDMKKLLRQMNKLKKQLKTAQEASGTEPDIQQLQETTQTLQEKLIAVEAERDASTEKTKITDTRCKDLKRRIALAEETAQELQEAAGARVVLEAAQTELYAVKQQVETQGDRFRSKQQEVDEKAAIIKDKDRQLMALQVEHEELLREKDMKIKDLENEIRKLQRQLAKLQEKLGISDEDSRLDQDVNDLEDKVTQLEKQILDLEAERKLLKAEKDHLDNINKDLEKELRRQDLATEIHVTGAPLAMSTPVPSDNADLQDLTEQIAELQRDVDQKEAELREERTNHDMTREELEIQTSQLQRITLDLDNMRLESEAKLEATEAKLNDEIEDLKKRLSEAEERAETLEAAQLAGVPPDTATIIRDLKAKLKAKEEEKSAIAKDKSALQAQLKSLQAKINSLEKSSKLEKNSNTGTEAKLKQLKLEKDKEIQQVQGAADKKEHQRAEQERKKINALEQKIRVLEAGGGAAPGGRAKSAVGRGDGQALKALPDKLRDAKHEISELKTKIRQLENDLKRSGGAGAGGAGDVEAARQMKKQEKVLKEMEKIIDMEKKKNQKLEDNNKKLDHELKDTQKALQDREKEVQKLAAELAALGVSAKAAADLTKDLKKLQSDMKKLTAENKTLAENFNSERVLRKKYYNMVEDMKGKIRVYCRVRPMSKSELDRGNHSVTKSPDEYSIVVDSNRGIKEFQFDTVFMPDSTQDKVFEDTNNLVQSAVDGYNVCIFAYGQTGSGKTFTIIGDREQKHPGIAPRAFEKIFELLQENKSKFSYKVSCYMLELYNDKLLDLFVKGAQDDEKLEIKKDPKGMVVVQGAEIRTAKNAKTLYELFEEGSKTRHTASTKMNAESSRSHLVIGIIIETTNRTSGAVLKGKLSLVDLAGSERAAKTEASAQQLKEAMSINKSLSALGDVISALSSEQQFIPYRNNKLTMLMQDSLGGNAKTLMFVNVSPADYNTDETVVSLTYASRVKLITNDAQKNSDNKEIARLRTLISKMKKGEATEED